MARVLFVCYALVALASVLLVEGGLLAPDVKVVNGGFGSGGTWVESGNRLPDNWRPIPYDGTCVSQSSTGRPIQAVGYGGDGATCNFQPFIASMPAIFRQGWLIAASQDVYNGFHLPDVSVFVFFAD